MVYTSEDVMEFEVILPSGKTLNIKLTSKELKGSVLMHQVFGGVNITGDSTHYFGLRYPDKDDAGMNWLLPDDNLKTLSYLSSRGSTTIQLAVRIFPENPDLVFPTAEARCLFRQYLKSMLLNNELGCDTKKHAMLDACIVQAEIGDYSEETKLESYEKQLGKLDIYAPTSLCAATPINETTYLKTVRVYHKRLVGTRSAQADIMYLSLVQKLPLYGYAIYKVFDKIHKDYFVAFSNNGINFIYESYLESFSIPRRKEVFAWGDIVFCELNRNKVKLGFFQQGTEFVSRSLKIKSKYSQRGACRFQADLNKYKEVFLNVVDGGEMFDSRKKARKCHSAKIPRRTNTWNSKLTTIRLSLRNSLKRNKTRNRSNNEEEEFTSRGDEKRRIQSE